MKPEEALDVLKRMRIAMATAKVDGTRVLEPLNFAIQSLEKQIPKKPIKIDREHFITDNCKTCEKTIAVENALGSFDKFNYCPECGQKLKWEE